MGKIGYGYGSEWHLLRYLGYHRHTLNNEILKSIGGQSITWLDFEFTTKNKPLARDREWRGLEFIDAPVVQQLWRGYWPQTGSPPNWDAVGKLTFDKETAWLLVEAKAHGGELISKCGAGQKSRIIIENAFEQTRAFYDITTPIENWFEPYYQYCNRLAVLHFLRNVCQPSIPTYLVFIYFCGDTNPNGQCPQTVADWQPILDDMYHKIGLGKDNKIREYIHNIFLQVNPASNGIKIDTV